MKFFAEAKNVCLKLRLARSNFYICIFNGSLAFGNILLSAQTETNVTTPPIATIVQYTHGSTKYADIVFSASFSSTKKILENAKALFTK